MTRPRRRFPSLAEVSLLTVVWILLWDRVTLLTLLSGAVLAVLVTLVFPLPPLPRTGRFRPVALAKLLGGLFYDMARASIGVVVLAFSFGTIPHSSIIKVQLWSRSDLYLTLTSDMVSLVPGTLVLEVHRSSSTLYLHVLNRTDPAGLAEAVRDALASERRVVRAFGTREEIAALQAGMPYPDTPEGVRT
jgi:multicomponent Na+:H+ antiporter subunit E